MEKSDGGVQSVRRALQLLTRFAPQRTSHAPSRSTWTVSDLARVSGLHKSVVARLMATMAVEGFVIQDPTTKAYSIGPQAFAVGSTYEPFDALNKVARPIMEDLTARCGHASYVGVRAGAHYVIIIAVESIRSIRVTIAVGERRGCNSGAIGKILLAGMSDDEIRELLGPEPLPQRTPHTITTYAELLAEVDQVRRTGLAFNREEAMIGVGSVAVGVSDSCGDCIAGLGIVFPTHVVADTEIDNLSRIVADAGAAISRRLGAPQSVPT